MLGASWVSRRKQQAAHRAPSFYVYVVGENFLHLHVYHFVYRLLLTYSDESNIPFGMPDEVTCGVPTMCLALHNPTRLP